MACPGAIVFTSQDDVHGVHPVTAAIPIKVITILSIVYIELELYSFSYSLV